MIDNVNRSQYCLDYEGDMMSTIPTQIRIDSDVKKQATALFGSLGLDLSSAVNIFLHQCVLRGGLPFSVEMPQYNRKVLDAMAEAKRISQNPDVWGYDNMEDLKETLESD